MFAQMPVAAEAAHHLNGPRVNPLGRWRDMMAVVVVMPPAATGFRAAEPPSLAGEPQDLRAPR